MEDHGAVDAFDGDHSLLYDRVLEGSFNGCCGDAVNATGIGMCGRAETPLLGDEMNGFNEGEAGRDGRFYKIGEEMTFGGGDFTPGDDLDIIVMSEAFCF